MKLNVHKKTRMWWITHSQKQGSAVNAPSKKRGKPKASQKKKEQPTTGTILAYAQHEKSKEASNVAVVFKHVLMVADTVIRMEQNMRNVS